MSCLVPKIWITACGTEAQGLGTSRALSLTSLTFKTHIPSPDHSVRQSALQRCSLHGFNQPLVPSPPSGSDKALSTPSPTTAAPGPPTASPQDPINSQQPAAAGTAEKGAAPVPVSNNNSSSQHRTQGQGGVAASADAQAGANDRAASASERATGTNDRAAHPPHLATSSTPVGNIKKSKCSQLLPSPVSILKRTRPEKRVRGAVLFSQQLVLGPSPGYK